MGTRIFKKPDLRKLKAEVPESIFRDPKELAKLKDVVKPEVYLKDVYDKIEAKEADYAVLENKFEVKDAELSQGHLSKKTELEKDIRSLEDVLLGKRQEREYLEKPLVEKEKALTLREAAVKDREKDVADKEQDIFEREAECKRAVESVKELAGTLGDEQVQIKKEKKRLSLREDLLKERETTYLLRDQHLRDTTKKIEMQLIKREEGVALKEMNVQSKEESFAARESKLSKDFILLADQRGTLSRAWKELHKKYGFTKEG